jgi:hypothetical protein
MNIVVYAGAIVSALSMTFTTRLRVASDTDYGLLLTRMNVNAVAKYYHGGVDTSLKALCLLLPGHNRSC